jgi:hypothetical protein
VISPFDVATALGRPVPYGDQESQWSQMITDVRLRLRLSFGDLNLLDQEVVDYVTREVVVSMILSVDENNPVPAVVIRSDLLALLTPAVTSGGAFSVRPTFDKDQTWLSLTYPLFYGSAPI